MNSYERRFKIFLEKDELAQLPPEEPVLDNSGDIDAMQNTLDDGSQVTDFDVQNVNQLQQDIQLFDKIKTSENKRIARVASDLGAFNEILKGYIASGDDPKNRFV